MHWKLDIYDRSQQKLCELYDSELKPEGQAYDVVLTTEISGWKELSFSLPQTINGKRNFRWDFVRSGYLIRLAKDDAIDWFLLNAPKRTHKGVAVSAAITCQHVCA